MNEFPNFEILKNLRPKAKAQIKGSIIYFEINGQVWFYETKFGVLIVADIEGLPKQTIDCNSPIFAFHIHEGGNCTGNNNDLFSDVGMHYNPNNCQHPYHAGDLPPLFTTNGNAFLVVLTDRFKVEEVIGRTVVIHSKVDDFTTQPAGNSGTKIACGEIKMI